MFLPGEREIRDTADALADLRPDRGRTLEIVPLFSRLSAAEQHRVFSSHPATVRRVVLATNVAETSLTVPGIRYVVDTGLARISRYSLKTKVQRLPIEAVSQASARQRSGRCGRVEAGIAIRLYAEEDFESRPDFTDPEILRTNLASVILQMTSLGLGDVGRFPFVEPPDRRNVSAGVQLLEELGALGTGGREARLTKVGRRLARLPIDPRLGRMILEAERLGCVREILVIAAALSLQDPRERPLEEQAQADQLHARFKDPTSDFLSWLNLWRHLRAQQRELSSSAFRRMCKREYLNYLRVREWQDFESQLRQVCRELKVELGKEPAWSRRHATTDPEATTETDPPSGGAPYDADGIHQALLSGLLSHVGVPRGAREVRPTGQKPRGPREYLGARGTRFAIFPGSGLRGKNPAYLMAGELVETGRLWARQNAAIKPEWAERVGAHLVKRTYSEPHWSRKRAAVMAHERVTLYGVPLVTDRLVAFGKIDRELSRELFIRHALVYGEWSSRHPFLGENQRLLEEAEELEHRARRRDIVVDEHTLFDFYDARVGAEVVSGAHFDQWWKQERRTRPDLLTFDPAMLTHDTAEEVRAEDFPEAWRGEGLTFPISYHFEPGAVDDGLTIDVPVATLNRVAADDFSWNVPGVRHELVTSLIRSLPKNLRVSFVPAPDRAREFLAAVPPGEEPLLDALERWARSTTGVVIPREAWDWSKVAAHLQPTYRVVGETGDEQARGKDLEALKAPLRSQFDEALAAVADDSGLGATGQTAWTFGEHARGDPADAGGARGARLPCPHRRGHDRRPGGLRLPRRRPRRDTGSAYVGCCCSSSRRATRRPTSTPPTGSAWPARRTPPSPSSSTTSAARSSPTSWTPGRPRAPSRSTPRWSRPVARRWRARTDPVLSEVLRILSDWRDTDRMLSGRAELATLRRTPGHARAAGPAGGPRLPGGGGSRPAAPLPDVPPGGPPPPRAARGRRAPRPPADGPGHRGAGRRPPPARRPARGPPTRRTAATRALDAGGVPRLVVRPAARHRRAGQRPADPHPARRLTTERTPSGRRRARGRVGCAALQETTALHGGCRCAYLSCVLPVSRPVRSCSPWSERVPRVPGLSRAGPRRWRTARHVPVLRPARTGTGGSSGEWTVAPVGPGSYRLTWRSPR